MSGNLLTLVFAATAVALVASYDLSNCQKDFENSMLDRHNFYRRKHGVQELTVDSTLSQSAQNYAEYLAKNNIFEHSDTSYGENLAYRMDSTFQMDSNLCKRLGAEMTDAWYNEVDNPGYTYGNDYTKGTGHFTQVVWAGTSKIGCGIGVTSSGLSFYGVAQYDPAGNVSGEFAENVKAPSSKST